MECTETETETRDAMGPRTRDANGERVVGGARSRESKVGGRAAEVSAAVRRVREDYPLRSEGHTRGDGGWGGVRSWCGECGDEDGGEAGDEDGGEGCDDARGGGRRCEGGGRGSE